jgi:cyanophycinase-like exopeptidase
MKIAVFYRNSYFRTAKFIIMYKIKFIAFIALIFISANIMAQGKLLLIGGGSEKDTEKSWNRSAYKWAVDQSKNKKVAIIAYGSATDWLPDYFVNHCGANSATNFNISTLEVSNSQSAYDNLMAHDVIFIKGGDQFNYYQAYKGTKTQQAIEDKYQDGGVICGHICRIGHTFRDNFYRTKRDGIQR